MHTIRADHGVRAHASAVGKDERDPVRIPVQVHQSHAEVDDLRRRRGFDGGVKLGAVEAQKGRAEFFFHLLAQLELAGDFSAVPLAAQPQLRTVRDPLQPLLDPEAAQDFHGVGSHLNARPDAPEAAGLLVHLHVGTGAVQQGRDRQAADAGADDRDGERLAHSGWIFAAPKTLRHLGISRRMKAANSSGVLGVTSTVLKRSRISGPPSTLLMSSESRCTMAAGVWAGARMPNHIVDSYPGSPASCTVGSSGAAALRRALVTASTRTLPARASLSPPDPKTMSM